MLLTRRSGARQPLGLLEGPAGRSLGLPRSPLGSPNDRREFPRGAPPITEAERAEKILRQSVFVLEKEQFISFHKNARGGRTSGARGCSRLTLSICIEDRGKVLGERDSTTPKKSYQEVAGTHYHEQETGAIP